MNFFKLLFIFALLLFGSFGQRFLRHSINDALIDGKDSDDDLLSSDGLNAQEVDGDVKLTGFIKEIELELKGNELMFEYCSKRIAQNKQRCMDQTVYACYDAKKPSVALRGHCRPNQCCFEAGISKSSSSVPIDFVWFMDITSIAPLDENKDICPTAIMHMHSSKADVTVLGAPPPSCEPLIIEGKIKLYAIKATPKCFLTVKNAKIWTPTTTPAPTTPPPAIQSSADKGANEETSNVAIIGIIVGVILFILLIGIIAFVVWYFCIRKQNKAFDKKTINAETLKHTAEADVVQEKKEPVKPKAETVEKKKPVEKEKASKPKKKEKKVVQKIQLKPSKEVTQKNVTKAEPPKKQASVEPTLDNSIADASIVHAQQQPHVFVPKTVIYPAPLQPASKAITQYSKSSSRKGSLSGRHEIGIMADSTSESVKHALDTESGMEEESTQVSITRPSEKKRKKKSGKKKRSKKRH
uniref:Uncharacterized protein n=1 Tax=Panagrolaimus davidi TaxID=227884 RepID=A0A914PWN8_9BILA